MMLLLYTTVDSVLLELNRFIRPIDRERKRTKERVIKVGLLKVFGDSSKKRYDTKRHQCITQNWPCK